MAQLTLVNGNNQQFTIELPTIVIIGKLNSTAIDHIFQNTGLNFTDNWNGHKAQPHNSDQIVKLLLTYNFKTRYYNNATIKNTIYLKSDHHIGFDVDDICYECAKRNRVAHNLKPGNILAC